MRRLVFASILAGSCIGLVAGAVTYRREVERNYPPPNILILSLCSLRKAEMEIFNPTGQPSLTPRIDRAFRSGLALDQVYSSFGWTNLALYFLRAFDQKFLNDQGYDVIADELRPLQVSVRASTVDDDPAQMVHHIHPKLQYLQGRISLHRSRPFFAYVHIKYMHYPYKDGLNPNSGWDKFLSPEEKLHIERVLREPQLLREKLPFALTLSGEPDLLKSLPEFRPLESDPVRVFFGLYNLMVDRISLAQWASHEDYEKELGILRKVYRAKLNKLDEILEPVLDLYGRQDLKDNTILILMGDHGEAFMEHGHLGHAMHVYDEILTPPVLVRFPRVWRLHIENLQKQVYMGSLADWIMSAVKGRNREGDFRETVVGNPKNEYIISRNCSNSIHSLRWDGRWKFIVDRANREKMLFDLQTDPKEMVNVAEQHPDLAARLELELTARLGDLDAITDPTPCQL